MLVRSVTDLGRGAVLGRPSGRFWGRRRSALRGPPATRWRCSQEPLRKATFGGAGPRLGVSACLCPRLGSLLGHQARKSKGGPPRTRVPYSRLSSDPRPRAEGLAAESASSPTSEQRRHCPEGLREGGPARASGPGRWAWQARGRHGPEAAAVLIFWATFIVVIIQSKRT